jgi:hypothetical protein
MMRPYRSTWTYEVAEGWDIGDAVDVTVTPDHVLIAVTEEQAMESYNQEFTCSVAVPYSKVAELHQLLGKALYEASRPTQEQ